MRIASIVTLFLVVAFSFAFPFDQKVRIEKNDTLIMQYTTVFAPVWSAPSSQAFAQDLISEFQRYNRPLLSFGITASDVVAGTSYSRNYYTFMLIVGGCGAALAAIWFAKTRLYRRIRVTS